jgi:Ca-activated chloride channel family protein
MSGLSLFHFLRPLWLLAVPAVCLLWWLIRRRQAQKSMVGEFVAPHLREALVVNQEVKRGLRPVDWACIAGLAAALAAAGPSWSKQPSPWFSETAPLVVAIKVSDSMRANDVQPTRLDRARFKLLDLVEARTGSRTAIIAYADSAHIVVPPSSDIDVIKPLLESLDPAIMPKQGSNASSVLPLATELLSENAVVGTILFVNDGFDPADLTGLAEFSKQEGAPAMAALVVGTEEGGVALYPDGTAVSAPGGGRLDTRLDTTTLQRVEREAGIPVVRMSTDDADVRHVMRAIDSNLQQADDPNAQWNDGGWWLLWPAALLTLLWFRRGWTMQW